MTNLRLAAYPTNYEEAATFLGNKASAKLGYATTIERLSHRSIGIRHYSSVIVEHFSDGRLEVSNGGWNSKTTAHRLHILTPPWIRFNILKGQMVINTTMDDGMDNIPMTDRVYIFLP